MRGRNQGGSLAGFIIIGVLLTLVLAGGLYGLNRYNAQKAAEETAVNGEQEEAANEESPTQSRTEERQEAPGATGTQSRTETPQSTVPAASSTTSTTGSSQLPQSGPTDVVYMLLAIGLLTFAGTHYLRSRA